MAMRAKSASDSPNLILTLQSHLNSDETFHTTYYGSQGPLKGIPNSNSEELRSAKEELPT